MVVASAGDIISVYSFEDFEGFFTGVCPEVPEQLSFNDSPSSARWVRGGCVYILLCVGGFYVRLNVQNAFSFKSFSFV